MPPLGTMTGMLRAVSEWAAKQKPGINARPGRSTIERRVLGIAREKALVAARAQAGGMNVETENSVGGPLSSNEEGGSLQEDETINDLPPYVPSAETLLPCNGIRDVLITGNTDPRHAAVWGNWVWKGRVRKWDGMVGLVRSANNGPNGISTGNGGGGKIFLYGTILRGRNLVGTWRLAHDPRMPAYEGAFTLGRKDG
ncbi:hypothetical protein DFJ43DRAFT_567771 [Lentinula guzmanii]|uniref:Uncharacterized protein n=1 Tax=Lentinula guzmanii TaxID=2804957 RepID=A0AA38J631_9AGAR|nr:hypothetical protein DFJ43DRAFT_567771 [Lentinula guzmanii]